MAARTKTKNSWLTVLFLVVAIGIWVYNQTQPIAKAPGKVTPPREERPVVTEKISPPAARPPGTIEKTGGYEIYRNCTLAEARNNDGDSFMVRLPDGRKSEFRLYFVDTPESAFKRYAGGETNHERIRQQAAELGGITPEQAVEIGKKGKAFTLGLLGSRPFTIYTAWDSPFNDNRFHAHIEVNSEGKPRWLHQSLIERGLARIKTKPADLPDGTSATKEKESLRQLEREAKGRGIGVWAY